VKVKSESPASGRHIPEQNKPATTKFGVAGPRPWQGWKIAVPKEEDISEIDEMTIYRRSITPSRYYHSTRADVEAKLESEDYDDNLLGVSQTPLSLKRKAFLAMGTKIGRTKRTKITGNRDKSHKTLGDPARQMSIRVEQM